MANKYLEELSILAIGEIYSTLLQLETLLERWLSS